MLAIVNLPSLLSRDIARSRCDVRKVAGNFFRSMDPGKISRFLVKPGEFSNDRGRALVLNENFSTGRETLWSFCLSASSSSSRTRVLESRLLRIALSFPHVARSRPYFSTPGPDSLDVLDTRRSCRLNVQSKGSFEAFSSDCDRGEFDEFRTRQFFTGGSSFVNDRCFWGDIQPAARDSSFYNLLTIITRWYCIDI